MPIRSIIIAFSLLVLLPTELRGMPPPLSCAKRVVLPIYPKLAKLAHDSRTVSVKIKSSGGALAIVDVKGGNRYFDEAIRSAVSAWTVSPARQIPDEDFVIVFDFRMTEDSKKDGLGEIDIDDGKIIVWGLVHFTDTEQLPVAHPG